jgi:glycerol-3-phosphate cytidylyltransferase-like family protein/5-methylcytosine-specific restriction endonuclease McrA
MVSVRDKKRGKLPHRKKAIQKLSTAWVKKMMKDPEYRKILNEKAKKRRQKDPEKYRKWCREWSRANVHKKIASNRKRKIAKQGIIGSHKESQWKRCKEEYNNSCAICGITEQDIKKKYFGTQFDGLTRDHIVPISLGGTDYINNIQPLCVSCNSSKHNKLIGPVVCVSGGMDPVTVGHTRLFAEAHKYGRLVVILNSDEWLIKKKGYNFMSWEDRSYILMGFEYIHSVERVDDSDGTVCEALKRLRPDYFANGGDRASHNTPEVELCNTLGIKTIWNIGGGKVSSSSELVNRQLRRIIQ